MKILKNFFSRFPRTFNLLRIIYSMKLVVLTKNIQVSFCFSEVSVKFPHVSVQSWLDGKKKKKRTFMFQSTALMVRKVVREKKGNLKELIKVLLLILM